MRRLVLMAWLALSTGCMDTARVNERCIWTEGSSRRLDLRGAADRDHLRQDAQVAGELGVRAADVHYRNRPDLGDPIQQACTAAMIDTIARRHGLPRERVMAAAYARVWWADLLVVYLPLAAAVVIVIDAIVRRIRRAFEPTDRLVANACIALFVGVVPVLGLGVGQFWAFTIEAAFLHNEHIAFRGTFIPILRHGWIAVGSLAALCAFVAVWRAMRTPLCRVERSYASYLGARART